MADFEALIRNYLTLGTTDIEGFLALMDDEIVVEFPYGESAGFPSKLEGRDAIRAGLGGFLASVPSIRFLDIVIHTTSDPDIAFATYRADAPVPATGKRYRQQYVAQFWRRNDKLIRFREWFDPVPLVEAFQ